MKHYAKITEDNGGGLTLYVLNEHGCVWAHSGYEYRLKQLRQDIDALIADDSVAEWDGNEPDLVTAWDDLDLDGIGIALIAEISDHKDGTGYLTVYSSRMGSAGHAAFPPSDTE